jgi:hypothetical protein
MLGCVVALVVVSATLPHIALHAVHDDILVKRYGLAALIALDAQALSA